MFEEAARVGGLSVQLVYYRGQGECRAGRWLADPRGFPALSPGFLATSLMSEGKATRKIFPRAPCDCSITLPNKRQALLGVKP